MWFKEMNFSVVRICAVIFLTKIQMGQTQIYTNPSMIGKSDNFGLPIQQYFYPPNLTSKLTEEFLDFLQLITPSQYNPQLIDVKNKLQNLVMNNQLEVARIMNYAKSFKDITNFDRLLVALFALRDTLPQSCDIKKHLRNLLLYSIINKEKLIGNVHPYDKICHQVRTSYDSSNYCQNLCDRMRSLPSSCNGDSNGAKEVPNLSIAIPIEPVKNEIKRLDNPSQAARNIPDKINQLISMLPKPQFAEEENMHKTLSEFLHLPQMYVYLQNLNPDDYSNEELLKNILEHVAHLNVPDNIKDAAELYLNYDDNILEILRKKYDFAALIQFLPEAITEDEEEYYEIAASFLNSSDVYHYFRSIDLSSNKDPKSLFMAVVGCIANSRTLDKRIVNAFKYYADYEDYEDLELITKKVIFKNFKILKTFRKVINRDALDEITSMQFKILLRYISKSGKILTDFEIPPQAHTQAEFVTAILNYLSSYPEVPVSVKNIIQTIQPHVIYSGEGATIV